MWCHILMNIGVLRIQYNKLNIPTKNNKNNKSPIITKTWTHPTTNNYNRFPIE